MKCTQTFTHQNIAQKFIDQKYGLIHELKEYFRPPGEPLLFFYQAEFSVELNGSSFEHSTGAALNRESALEKSFYEAIERYCFDRTPSNLPRKSWKGLGETALHPAKLPGYSDSQYLQPDFPYVPFDENTQLAWVEGYSLSRKVSTWVPAQLVYRRAETETPIFQSSTTGLACGSSIENATLTGLFEVLERDAITLMWMNKLSMPTLKNLENTHDSPALAMCGNRFFRPHLRYTAINLTTNLGIPVFCVIVRQTSGAGPAFGMGAACRLDPVLALEKAWFEAAASRYWLAYAFPKFSDRRMTPHEAFKLVKTSADHALIYASSRFLRYAKFIDSSTKTQHLSMIPSLSTGNPITDLQCCVSLLAQKGYDVIAVDVTKEELQPLGVNVVKVIVPGLQPLHFGWGREFLRNSRLYDIPQQLGHANCLKMENEIYRVPHPFS